MHSRGALPTLILSLALIALADPTPTTPSSGDVFAEGDDCQIAWVPDQCEDWKNMKIELMTGDNDNPVVLTSQCCWIFK